ncbi:MAG: hypothetical protein C5B49_07285 [Bdellovibrio sp.]|nr:MAG: hypothetical protein C5B49_07285 [Bdellovibrio sp.]
MTHFRWRFSAAFLNSLASFVFTGLMAWAAKPARALGSTTSQAAVSEVAALTAAGIACDKVHAGLSAAESASLRSWATVRRRWEDALVRKVAEQFGPPEAIAKTAAQLKEFMPPFLHDVAIKLRKSNDWRWENHDLAEVTDERIDKIVKDPQRPMTRGDVWGLYLFLIKLGAVEDMAKAERSLRQLFDPNTWFGKRRNLDLRDLGIDLGDTNLAARGRLALRFVEGFERANPEDRTGYALEIVLSSLGSKRGQREFAMDSQRLTHDTSDEPNFFLDLMRILRNSTSPSAVARTFQALATMETLAPAVMRYFHPRMREFWDELMEMAISQTESDDRPDRASVEKILRSLVAENLSGPIHKSLPIVWEATFIMRAFGIENPAATSPHTGFFEAELQKLSRGGKMPISLAGLAEYSAPSYAPLAWESEADIDREAPSVLALPNHRIHAADVDKIKRYITTIAATGNPKKAKDKLLTSKWGGTVSDEMRAYLDITSHLSRSLSFLEDLDMRTGSKEALDMAIHVIGALELGAAADNEPLVEQLWEIVLRSKQQDAVVRLFERLRTSPVLVDLIKSPNLPVILPEFLRKLRSDYRESSSMPISAKIFVDTLLVETITNHRTAAQETAQEGSAPIPFKTTVQKIYTHLITAQQLARAGREFFKGIQQAGIAKPYQDEEIALNDGIRKLGLSLPR